MTSLVLHVIWPKEKKKKRKDKKNWADSMMPLWSDERRDGEEHDLLQLKLSQQKIRAYMQPAHTHTLCFPPTYPLTHLAEISTF